MIFRGKISNGHISAKIVGSISVLFPAHHLIMHYICTNFLENIGHEKLTDGRPAT